MLSSSSSLLLVITGASRGFGRAIANVVSASQRVDKVQAVLVARSADGLRETEKVMRASANGQVDVSSHVMDLSNLDQLDTHLDELLSNLKLDELSYDRVVLINVSFGSVF
jgi:short-subunit dehydrogenase